MKLTRIVRIRVNLSRVNFVERLFLRKEKEEKKRSEEKKVITGIECGTFNTLDQSFTTRLRGTPENIRRNFIIKIFEP